MVFIAHGLENRRFSPLVGIAIIVENASISRHLVPAQKMLVNLRTLRPIVLTAFKIMYSNFRYPVPRQRLNEGGADLIPTRGLFLGWSEFRVKSIQHTRRMVHPISTNHRNNRIGVQIALRQGLHFAGSDGRKRSLLCDGHFVVVTSIERLRMDARIVCKIPAFRG